MDYIKYLIITILSFVFILFVMQFFPKISTMFGVAIAIFLFLAKMKKEDHAIGFFFWIIFIVLAIDIAKNVTAEYVNTHPDMKSSPATFKDTYILMLMVITHPISYGLGKLTVFAGDKLKKIREKNKKNN